MSLCVFLLFGSILFLARGFGAILLTRWAARHALCLAQGEPASFCQHLTRSELEKYFGMRGLTVRVNEGPLVLHTELTAIYLSLKIRSVYDLGTAEFRRVSEGRP